MTGNPDHPVAAPGKLPATGAVDSKKEGEGADDTPKNETPIPVCTFCGTSMPNKARLCPNCDRWQFSGGWLISQISLGDIALYGSIVVVLWSSFNIALTGKKAKFDATPLSCSAFAADVFIGNTGTTRGILLTATVTPVGDGAAGKTYSAQIVHSDGQKHLSLAPEADGVITVSLAGSADSDRGEFAVSSAALPNCTVTIELEAIHRPNGSTISIPIPKACPCFDFRKD
ncbi:hypothetical protein [Poseidonocella sedimentorum]|uniref:Uncharacterized protein n=1 Tax=Poseidonocella sedimentorum TaxID=871652 RepID=A0A1I6DXI1_9RHOB|nr:hypothetical protein [Poseidonocella sedimentorum]SFR10126.1 hypothetical protein SAMN04515673_1064 [Poseidonocella sedimentorum]